MKAHLRILTLLFFTLVFFNFSALAEDLYVEVKSSKLRAEPKHWAAAKGDLRYGDRLIGSTEENGWYSVETSAGIKGFVHQSVVTKKKVVLRSTKAAETAHADDADLVLAGKGFNQQVESMMRSQDGTLNFTSVDRMERRAISDSALLQFMKAGKLGGVS